jgi:predicted enzyme related to lactoylglutathione lyase
VIDGAAVQAAAPPPESRMNITAGRFCWLDLAATDAADAGAFYAGLFGWTARDQTVNGGCFTRLAFAGREIGSLYQLSRREREAGVPSHWTPYVGVADADASARRAAALGGSVLVRPFDVEGVARIAMVADVVGAPFGLWQPWTASHG